jgi:ribosomal protein S18 acetylase RimI-like enzyme
MAQGEITFKCGRQVPYTALRAFFKRCQWYDWFTRADVEHYLKKALYIATAWHGRKIVGFAALKGDGRNDVSLDSLVVDYTYQRRGIGTALMKMALAKVEELRPYHFEAQVCDEQTERFYRRCGFVRNQGTWLLEHKSTADKLRARVNRIRKRANR